MSIAYLKNLGVKGAKSVEGYQCPVFEDCIGLGEPASGNLCKRPSIK